MAGESIDNPRSWNPGQDNRAVRFYSDMTFSVKRIFHFLTCCHTIRFVTPCPLFTCNDGDVKFWPFGIVVAGLMSYRNSSTFFFFFFCQSPSALPERNSTKTGHMLGSECDLKMYVRYLGYPLKSGAEKPPTKTISQLNGNFNGLCLRNETRCTYLGKCFGNYKGSPTSSQNVVNFGPQTA